LRKKGYIFLDVIVGIFLLGLVTVTSLPILASSFNNFNKINMYSEINYLGEHIFERLSSYDEYSKDFLLKLEEEGEIFFLDLDNYYLEKYDCKVINTGINEYLWEFKIVIYPKENKGNYNHEEFKGSIPKK